MAVDPHPDITSDAAALQTLLDRLPAAVALWDRDLRNVYANAHHEHWFGIDAAALRGRRLADLLGEPAMACLQPRYDRALAGEEVSYEAQLPTRQGPRQIEVRLLPRRSGETVVGLIALVVDISAQRQAQQALAERNDLLRLLYEGTPALLLSIDHAGRLLAASDRWLETLGLERTGAIGRLLADVMTEESRRRMQSFGLPALYRDGRIDRWAFELVCADGRRLSVLLSAVVERGAAEPRALAVLEDITAVLARAAELRREHEARIEVERHARELDALLAERNRMIDVLAHEVRQPLNNASAALQSAAALLADRGEDAASERLRRAQGVLGEVLAGVDNTLAAAALYSGSAPPALADVDVDTLLALTIADLPPAQRARIGVERETSTRTAAMDLGLVRLALRNLLANALAYSPAGSLVTLHVADSDEPLALLLDVVDTGPGIADELRTRLFERGARAPRADGRASHGLGLYIARRALELQGGRALLLETGPRGTTMRLELAQSAGA